MRVLFVTTTHPWPPTDGERVRTFNFLRELARETELTVLAPEGPSGGSAPEALRDARWHPYTCEPLTHAQRALSYLTLTPVFYRAARCAEAQRWLSSVPRGGYDVVHLDGLPALNYLDAAQAITSNVVADVRDSWSLLYGRLWRTHGRSAARWLKRLAVERLERAQLTRTPRVVFISEVDADHVRARYGLDPARLAVVPNGVNEELFGLPAYAGAAPGAGPCIMFTGAMGYAPNEQAAVHFIHDILPKVRARLPHARFVVVGKDPSPALRVLASDTVEVTGAVPSVSAELRRADVVVAPLLSGSGMKNKVLEALAAGRPLVASPVAAEGIAVRDGEHLLIAREPDGWAEALARLHSDAHLAMRLAAQGRARVAEHYTWRGATGQLLSLYGGLRARTR